MPSMRCIQSKITFLASRNSFGCVTALMVTVKFDLSAYPCQLKWSMQHSPEVYPPASGILESFWVVDSRAARLGRAALENSQPDRCLEGSIAVRADWCFRSCRVARGFADRRNKPAHR